MGKELGPITFVMDSWPWLEWLKGRAPARGHVHQLVRSAIDGEVTLSMCRLNFGEVIYSIRKAPDISQPESALQKFLQAPIVLHSVDDVLVDEAVELKAKYPIAYADAFAAAMAMRYGVPLVTGDPEFRHIEHDGLLTLKWVGA